MKNEKEKEKYKGANKVENHRVNILTIEHMVR
jgi:hypothetical protein